MSTFNLELVSKGVKASLRNWHKIDQDVDNTLDDFVLIQNKRAEISGRTPGFVSLKAKQHVLLEAIESMKEHHQLAADILQRRFVDGETILAVSHRVNLSQDQLNRRQRDAIATLAKIIMEHESVLRKKKVFDLITRLPAKSYSALFGFSDIEASMTEILRQPDMPNLYAIIGLGGIGKSALADSVARRAILDNDFSTVIWIRATSYRINDPTIASDLAYDAVILELAKQLLPAQIPPQDYQREIIKILKLSPSLIVIDNLEFERDSSAFTTRLLELADPTKVLLTSRHHLAGTGEIYHLSLNEISFDDALSLMTHQARIIGMPQMENGIAANANTIYEMIGGNPLCLKLAVGLLDTLSLPDILDGLRRSRIPAIDEMYRHIFTKSWETLSSNDQHLLKIMPLVGEAGATILHLEEISTLDSGELAQAIQVLARRSLIEMRGTVVEKRYGIHRLTDSFLQSEII